VVEVKEGRGGGSLFVPPFVDCHVHLTETIADGKWVDLSKWDVERLRDELRKGVELYGVNLSPKLLGAVEKEVFPEARVVLKTRSRHSAYVSPLLYREVMGREGGGVLVGREHEEFFSKFSVSVEREEYGQFLSSLLRLGIGALCPLEGGWREESEFLAFHREWRGIPRLYPFLQRFAPAVAEREGWFGVGGCVLVDGAISARTAALWEEYEDEPTRGVLYLRAGELSSAAEKSVERGLWFTVHAIGDRAVSEVVRAYERVAGKGRLRLEHCVLARDEDLERLVDMKVLVCFQPAFERFFRSEYEVALGKRALRTNPYMRFFSLGGTFVVGTDSPITPISPRWTLLVAAERGEEVFKTVLSAYTHNAYQHLGLRRGRVVRGVKFVLLEFAEGFDYNEEDLGLTAFWFGAVDLTGVDLGSTAS
jgi:hypothetical protein